MRSYGVVLGAVVMASLLAPAALLADFYDDFYDGDHSGPEDPNVVWDIDDPCWIVYEPLGNPNAVGVVDGWLRLWTASTWFPSVMICSYPDTGDYDPNTSDTYWGHTLNHYVLAKTRNADPQPDPNDDTGSSALLMHASPVTWLGFAFEYPYRKYGGGDVLPRISSVQGFDWYVFEWKHIAPDDPCHADEANGFWMLFAYYTDGNPDASDPNNKILRAAMWNGEKFDWDGQWLLEVDLGDPCSWKEPEAIMENGDDWWCAEGRTVLGGVEYYNYVVDIAFDQIEARTGEFDPNNPGSLNLTVSNDHMGTITIDPDLLDDPNGDPNDLALLRRYTNGTEIVLVAEPFSGKSFKGWVIYDPNHPGDANYITQDTNATLYLTMDADWEIEAGFKCGGGVPPFVAVALLALGFAVAVRRLR